MFWQRGGYPSSLLPEADLDSWEWRHSFLQTIVERDIPNLGLNIPPLTLARFVRMLALQHGQLLNLATLGNSLGTSGHTIRHYLDILSGTFHIRLLEPWQKSHGKRLVKTPKVYFRDTGLSPL
jgi:predicted AAA+ superfamily ATPase